jgi:thiol-disulfide isomerase/thioredoxin
MPWTASRAATWLRRQRANWKSHLGTVALVLAVFFGVQAWQTRHVAAAPDLSMMVEWINTSGVHQSGTLGQALASIRRQPGQAVALHYWADWCPICRTEETSITQLHQDWPVLTIAMQSGPLAAVNRVQQQRGLPWNTVIDETGRLTRSHGFKAVPAFAVLDAHGRLRAPTVGYTTETGMRLRLWWATVF